ncbi:MAG: N-6 DNA methylase [Candidatus Helarchaeota archaeon]|nr:N-6 DNA methylase [Candidatus Helarchaeota archaeon]
MDPELVCDDVIFGTSIPEYSENITGKADLVIFDKKGSPWIVIEAKRVVGKSAKRDIDPYSPKVIKQAGSYAFQIGSNFFATYNGSILVLFKTFEMYKPILERKTKAYKIKNLKEFAASFLCDLVALERETKEWDALEKAFVSRILYFHQNLKENLQKVLIANIKTESFKKTLQKWLNKQGLTPSPISKKAIELISTQSAYVYMNLLIFRRILVCNKNYRLKIPNFEWIKLDSDLFFDYFQLLSKKIDFGAIFNIQDIFRQIPLPKSILLSLKEFKEELDEYDLSIFNNYTIGRIYEALMSSGERRRLGQYYTPPAIVEFITRNSIREDDALILDPAAGSGGFLVEAYRYITSKFKVDHNQAIKQIFGFDINQFALNLSSVNLAIIGLPQKTENLNLELTDFFLVRPGTSTLNRVFIDVEGEKIETFAGFPPKLDVCIANPPYIRQEKIPSKEIARKHLSDFNKLLIDKKADIYIYFITLATQLLKNHGRLGFIISDRWLTQEYGFGFQQFLLRNYIIEAIIKFETQVFEDALINACIILLEKSNSKDERSTNLVTFIRLKGKTAIKAIKKLIKAKAEISEDEISRQVKIKQEDLLCPEKELKNIIGNNKKSQEKKEIHKKKKQKKEKIDPKKKLEQKNLMKAKMVEYSKWIRFFYSYDIFYDILNHKNCCYLYEVMYIRSGLKTGANDFFYFKKNDVDELGLKEYVRPLLKGTGQVETIIFTPEGTEWLVLDIHNLIEPILDEFAEEEKKKEKAKKKEFIMKTSPKVDKYDEPILAIKVRNRLKKEHPKLAKYILEYGKNKELHKIKSVKSRKIWFDLGKLDIAPFLFPAEYWRNSIVVYNKSKIAADKRFYPMTPIFKHRKLSKDESTLLIAGILNSDIITLMRELTGRTASGQAMNRNECMIYEANSIRIPDPRKITEEDARNIINCFNKLVEKELEKKEIEVQISQKSEVKNSLLEKLEKLSANLKKLKLDLNKAVLKPLSYEHRIEELTDSIEELLSIREHGRGLNKKIPFTYSGKYITPKIKGAIVLQGNNSQNILDKFLQN